MRDAIGLGSAGLYVEGANGVVTPCLQLFYLFCQRWRFCPWRCVKGGAGAACRRSLEAKYSLVIGDVLAKRRT